MAQSGVVDHPVLVVSTINHAWFNSIFLFFSGDSVDSFIFIAPSLAAIGTVSAKTCWPSDRGNAKKIKIETHKKNFENVVRNPIMLVRWDNEKKYMWRNKSLDWMSLIYRDRFPSSTAFVCKVWSQRVRKIEFNSTTIFHHLKKLRVLASCDTICLKIDLTRAATVCEIQHRTLAAPIREIDRLIYNSQA